MQQKRTAPLNSNQKHAIRAGRPDEWQGCREVRVDGSTMEALERRGLAKVTISRKPYRRHVYKLTAAGNALRVEWALDSQTQPVERTPIRVRCTHCGQEFPDGTPGGSCICGLPVEAVA